MKDPVEIQDRASSARLLLDDPIVTEALAAIEREAFEEMMVADTSNLAGQFTVARMQERITVARKFKEQLEQAVSKAVVSRRRPPAVA